MSLHSSRTGKPVIEFGKGDGVPSRVLYIGLENDPSSENVDPNAVGKLANEKSCLSDDGGEAK
ncbi:MAG: hypothetical protein KTR28_06295 [Micavibrio sp.]|nr:hypothetical protein [Micavibrio sp.]